MINMEDEYVKMLKILENVLADFFTSPTYSIYNQSPYPSVQAGVDKWQHSFFNKLRSWQNGRHFPDDIVKCIFLNENV